jgi:hypothetical protein
MLFKNLKKEDLLKKLKTIDPEKTNDELEEILHQLNVFSTILLAKLKSSQNERPLNI